MWLVVAYTLLKLHLDLPAQPVFASDEGKGCELLREFSARKGAIWKADLNRAHWNCGHFGSNLFAIEFLVEPGQ